MDYGTRIAKVEAIMETNRQDIDRLYQAISELRKLILDRTDQFQTELLAQRKYIDDGFKELRREISINLRWTMGMALLNTSMILGIGGKLFGLY